MRLVQKALTFDDVLLVPAYSAVLPRDTSLRTKLTRSIELAIPLVSAAMDTVTEARLAIAMAQQGGIGIVHKNLKPEELVGTAIFLASAASNYVNGQIIYVDGGWLSVL